MFTTLNSRSIIILWHRWFGIFAALWLALMGITGTAIVFYGELDSWLNTDLITTQFQESTVPIEQWVTTAQGFKPGSAAYFINLPNEAGQTASIILSFKNPELKRVNVFIDPHTGQVLGERELGIMSFNKRYFMNMLYDLHMDLLLGDWMYVFLGLVAFLWLIDHFIVLWISFPKIKNWWQSFLIRKGTSGIKFHYDLHRASGLWLFPVTLMMAISGLYFNWNAPFESVVSKLSTINQRYIFTMEEHSEPLYSPRINFGSAVQIAQQEAGREVDIVTYYPYLQAYLARAFDERDIDPHARRLITIDANTGTILSDQHAASGSAGDVFMLWQYPLHSGQAFGWPGRLIVFLSGIFLVKLCVTGIMVWSRKFRARRSRMGKEICNT